MARGIFNQLIDAFKMLPGIGQKTAQRLAFFVLKMPAHEVGSLAQALMDAKERLRFCEICQNISEEPVCVVCHDPKRDRTRILVLREPSILYAMERTGRYKGLYHVLMGNLSLQDGLSVGLNGIEALDIKAKELIKRLQDTSDPRIEEVIMGTDPTAEGEATALYLSKLIKPLGVRVSRIAFGIPIGIDMDYADEVTLVKSLEGRRDV